MAKVKEKEKTTKFSTSLNFLLIYIALLLILFGRSLLGKSVFSYGIDDGTLILHPLRQLLANGKVFWTNKIFCGFPAFAEPHFAVAYPINWLLFKILPTEIAFSYLIVLEFIVAAFFTYLFARLVGLNETPAFFSAAAFSLLGFLPTYLGNSTVIHSSVWLPAVFYFLELSLQKKRLTFSVFASLFLAFQILAGFPQMAFITMVGAFFYYFFRFSQNKNQAEKDKIKLHGFFLVFLLFAFGFAAIQILPTYELTNFSARQAGLTYAKATEGSWSPTNILTFLFPYLFKGLPSQIGVAGLNYLGILPFILIFFSFLKRNDKQAKALWALTALAIFLALGYFNPFYRLIYYLPGFITFRAPSRFFLLAQFSLSILAGFGFNFLQEKENSKQAKKILKVSTICVLIAISLLLASSLLLSIARPQLINYGKRYVESKFYGQPDHPYPLDHYYQRLERFYNQILSTLSPANPRIFVPVIFIFSVFLLFWLKIKEKLKKDLFVKLALSLLLVDVLFFFIQGGLIPSMDRKTFIKKPFACQTLEKDKSLYRIYSYPHWEYRESQLAEASNKGDYLLPFNFVRETLQPNFNILVSQDSVNGYTGLYPFRISRLINLWEMEGNLSDEKRLNLLSQRYLKLLGWLNVKYILTKNTLNSENLEKIYLGNEVKVYRNRLWMPRFFLVSNYQSTNKNAIFKKITSLDFQPQEVVFLEEDLKAKNYQPFKKGKLKIIKYTETQIKLKAYLDGNGFLFISQSFYPGWQAKVNGKETTIYRANYAFQAVPLKPGNNLIDLRFQPTWPKIGAIISLLSLIVALAIILWEYFIFKGKHGKKRNQS